MKNYLIIPILAAVAVVVLAAVGCNRTNQTEENNVLVIESSMDTSSWQTYTNTKYGYSIRYPEGLELLGFTELGREPLTSESDTALFRRAASPGSIDPDSGEHLISISATQITEFTKEAIKEQYTSYINQPDQIHFARISVNGHEGIQILAAFMNEKDNYYYVKLVDDKIIYVTELKDNPEARAIFSTLESH
jgi:hypothetical protein